jgi:hypothetical protein
MHYNAWLPDLASIIMHAIEVTDPFGLCKPIVAQSNQLA